MTETDCGVCLCVGGVLRFPGSLDAHIIVLPLKLLIELIESIKICEPSKFTVTTCVVLEGGVSPKI